MKNGYVAFAGQRDDGFYGDINSIFDLLRLRNPGKDSQGGFNIHLMALEIPIAELGGDQQIVGVYATTSRQKVSVLRDIHGSNKKDDKKRNDDISAGPWVQVARQGNPLFNEGLVAIVDKDLYSRTSPSDDAKLFKKYALNPELAALINALVFPGVLPPPAIETRLEPPTQRLRAAHPLSKALGSASHEPSSPLRLPLTAVTPREDKLHQLPCRQLAIAEQCLLDPPLVAATALCPWRPDPARITTFLPISGALFWRGGKYEPEVPVPTSAVPVTPDSSRHSTT